MRRVREPHIVRDGENGRLVRSEDPEELADAMLSCITDGAMRGHVLVEAPRVREEYSWDAVATGRVYSDAVARDVFFYRENLRSMDVLLRLMRQPTLIDDAVG